MPQYMRPASDTTLSSWADSSGGAATIYTRIDETVQDNTDFIQSQVAPTSNLWYVTRLSSVEEPLNQSSHFVRYAYKKNSSGGAQIDLEVELRTNYASTASPGTSIISWTHTNIGGSAWTSAVQALSTAQVALATAALYSSGFLVFKPKQV